MTNITEEVIVQQNHLDGRFLFHYRTQLLQVHLQTAVTHKDANRAVGATESSADSGRR